jgi:transcriptional regulator with XRE-family HTH domain
VLGSTWHKFLTGPEKSVMNRDSSDNNTNAFPVLAVFRGLYQRVAAKLGVDPSFVSRVARGERKSSAVLAALQDEMQVIREHLNRADEFLLKNQQPEDGVLDGATRNGASANGKRKFRANGDQSKAAD